ncbi:MAG: Ig-like domain-containing protein [Acidobacteriota bacterium]
MSRPMASSLLLLVLLATAPDGSARPQEETTQPSSSALRVQIIAPPPHQVVAGPTRFAVKAEAATGRRIVQVRLFVNGRKVAVLASPPYETTFDAGQSFRSHTLRAEAVDDQGRLAADFATTRYVSFIEEMDVRTGRVAKELLLVGVLDRRKNPVRDLQRSDFEMRVDGAKEALVQVALDQRPLAVELLLDVSGSTVPYFPEIRRAASRFISFMSSDDGTEVSVFAGSTQTIAPFGTDHIGNRSTILTFRFQDDLPDLRPYGSHLYDALARSVESINVQPGQRSIAVFTDTFDTGSELSYKKVAEVIQRANIRIDLIRFGRRPAGDWSYSTRLLKRMRTLVRDTGGEEWTIRDPSDIVPTFEKLASHLKGRYRVVFAPEKEGPPRRHRLHFRMARRGLRVHAPSGYYD